MPRPASSPRPPHRRLWSLALLLLSLLALPVPRAAAADDPLSESGYSQQQIEQAFLSMKQGANDRAVEQATRLLEEAGKDAFPVLLKHLKSKLAASERHFKSQIWEIDPQTHLLKGRRPVTMGDVAFQFIQNAIEEDFPKQFKIFQILTRENVAAWLEANKFLSLPEMRAQAAQEALDKAEAQHRLEPTEHTAAAVRYMRGLASRYSQAH